MKKKEKNLLHLELLPSCWHFTWKFIVLSADYMVDFIGVAFMPANVLLNDFAFVWILFFFLFFWINEKKARHKNKLNRKKEDRMKMSKYQMIATKWMSAFYSPSIKVPIDDFDCASRFACFRFVLDGTHTFIHLIERIFFRLVFFPRFKVSWIFALKCLTFVSPETIFFSLSCCYIPHEHKLLLSNEKRKTGEQKPRGKYTHIKCTTFNYDVRTIFFSAWIR